MPQPRQRREQLVRRLLPKAKAAPSGKASSPAASSSPPSIMALGSAMAARQSYVQQFDLTPRNKPIRIHESTGETPDAQKRRTEEAVPKAPGQ